MREIKILKKSISLFSTLMILFMVWSLSGLTPAYSGNNPSVPAPPVNVLARGINSREIAVNWTQSEGAAGYRIFRSASPESGFIQVGETVGGRETRFTDRNLEPGVEGIQGLEALQVYYYKVAAFNSQGQSEMSKNYTHSYTDENGNSTTVVLNAGATLAPEAPRALTLKGAPNRVEISWAPNTEPNIEGYNLYRAEKSGAVKGKGLVKINDTLIRDNNYADLDTSNYVDYYYRVAAVVYDGEGILCEGVLSPEKHIRLEEAAPRYIPHLDFSSDSSPCATCHTTHSAAGPKLLTDNNEPNLCFTCHDGTGSNNITYQDFTNIDFLSRHPVPAGEKTGYLSCSDCHNPHLDYNARDSDGEKLFPMILEKIYKEIKYNQGNEICYSCHGIGSQLKGGDHATDFEDSLHNTEGLTPLSATGNKCSSCHVPHGAANENLKKYKEENLCFSCHYSDSPVAGNTNIYMQIFQNSDPDTRHDIQDADQLVNGSAIECHNCHNPHGIRNGFVNTDPDDPQPGAVWTGTAEPTITQPKEGTINEFCLRCHDGTYTDNGRVEPYAPQVSPGDQVFTDIAGTYYGDTATDAHGIIDGQPRNLDITMGYDNSSSSPNYILACTKCHDPHGSINVYNLKTDLASSDGSKVRRGLLTYTWSYTSDGVRQKSTDARYFCNGCHSQDHMGNSKPFPTDCFNNPAGCHGPGHGHGNKF